MITLIILFNETEVVNNPLIQYEIHLSLIVGGGIIPHIRK
jgi:hypothetical protein